MKIVNFSSMGTSRVGAIDADCIVDFLAMHEADP